MNTTTRLAAAILFAAVIFRLVRAEWLTSLPNLTPFMAVAFCAGAALPGMALTIGLGLAMVASDILINLNYGTAPISLGMLAIYACYALAFGTGRWFANRRPWAVAGIVSANAIFFYLVTNTLSWWANPHYAQTVAGWLQALTIGRPGFPPTWMFFRNAILADLAFTGAFFAVLYFARKRSASPNLCRQESSS